MDSLFDFLFMFKLFITMEKVQIVDLSELHFRLIPIESLSKEFFDRHFLEICKLIDLLILDGHFDGSIFDLLS